MVSHPTVKAITKVIADKRFKDFYSKYKLTRIITPTVDLSGTGIQEIDTNTEDMFKQYIKLISNARLTQLTPSQITLCKHYVLINNKHVVSGMSVLFASINNSMTQVCASVEMIVSRERGYATRLFEMLRSNLVKRRGTCFVLVQAAPSKCARRFWSKNTIMNEDAKYLSLMMFALDINYRLYHDTCHMMLKL